MASSSESSLTDTDENLVDCTDFNMTHQRLNKPHVTPPEVFLKDMSEQIGSELINMEFMDNEDCDVLVSNDVNKTEETETVLREMFPALSETSQQFNLLTNLVNEFLHTTNFQTTTPCELKKWNLLYQRLLNNIRIVVSFN